MIGVGARPLQAVNAQALIGHTAVTLGCQACHFIKYFFSTGVIHLIAHGIGKPGNNAPVGQGIGDGLDGFMNAQATPFRIGKGALFFGHRGGCQNNIRNLGGLGQKETLDHQKIQLGQCLV